jgi:hypothetical protein
MKKCVCQKIRDQIDDKYKVILGYTKPSSPSPFSSKPSSKPPFHTNHVANINLHEMSTYEFLQVHSHEHKPDPEPDEAIHDDLPAEEAEPEPSDTLLINAAKGSRPSPLPPGDIVMFYLKFETLSQFSTN